MEPTVPQGLRPDTPVWVLDAGAGGLFAFRRLPELLDCVEDGDDYPVRLMRAGAVAALGQDGQGALCELLAREDEAAARAAAAA